MSETASGAGDGCLTGPVFLGFGGSPGAVYQVTKEQRSHSQLEILPRVCYQHMNKIA